ncbi:MAG: ribokinase [Tepidisphaeraceae bacterium]
MPRITVVGSSNVDFVTRVPRLPGPGETVGGGSFSQVFGGKGANTATAVARLRGAGTHASFITAVGNDPFARMMLENFDRDGLDASASIRVDDIASGTASILVDPQGRNCIAVSPGANERLLPEHIDAAEALLRDSQMVVMQMELTAETTRHTIARCVEWKVPVMLNYAPVDAKAVPVDASIAILVVNEHEAAALMDGSVAGSPDDAIAVATALRRAGAGHSGRHHW